MLCKCVNGVINEGVSGLTLAQLGIYVSALRNFARRRYSASLITLSYGFGPTLAFCPLVFQSQGLVVQHLLRKLIETLWTQVVHSVILSQLVV